MRSSPITPTLCTGQQHREGLPELLVEPRRADLLLDDGVRRRTSSQPLLGDLAEDADGEARARERLALRRSAAAGPSSRPSARTSSLNSSRSGSTSLSFISSGSPPTLWWLLMVADGPLNETDSITSG